MNPYSTALEILWDSFSGLRNGVTSRFFLLIIAAASCPSIPNSLGHEFLPSKHFIQKPSVSSTSQVPSRLKWSLSHTHTLPVHFESIRHGPSGTFIRRCYNHILTPSSVPLIIVCVSLIGLEGLHLRWYL
ncbi:hypothetical protein AMTRI_Chr03g147490 [Amborella trichopoda]